MNPKYMLVLGLVLIGTGGETAVAMEERVETRIADNRWFRCAADEDYVCKDRDYQNKYFGAGKFDFTKLGCKNPNPTYKQFEYEFTLSIIRNNYTLMGLPFKPRAFWEKYMDEQLIYLKDAIQMCNLLIEAPRHHWPLEFTGNERCGLCLKSRTYSKELEEKFELAVWKILSKDYKITLEDFTASLRSALEPKDRLYTAPLLMHFTNYLVPKYKFHYKNGEYEPYKTLKYPSEFELANGIPNVGTVVYERKD